MLSLFLIPIGGGIPAGVLLAQKAKIAWPGMMLLYFISDCILACVFEPLMLWLIKQGKRTEAMAKVVAAMKEQTKKTLSMYSGTGPLTLIGIAFGVDPMTGRLVARLCGHGFLPGWAIAIAGDMIYFAVIMSSTLWLNSYLGDGTLTTFVILALMLGIPYLKRRLS